MNKRRTRATAVFLAAIVALGPALAAGSAQADGHLSPVDELSFTRSASDGSLSGSAHSVALLLSIDGNELTVAQGRSEATTKQRKGEDVTPLLPEELFIACGEPGAISIRGSQSCLDSDELAARGFDAGDRREVPVLDLVDQGVGQLSEPRLTEGFLEPAAQARSTAFVLGDAFFDEAVCDPETPSASGQAFEIPEGLSPLLTGSIASTHCAIDLAAPPNASHGAAEANFAVTLTRSIVEGGADQLLEGIQENIVDQFPDQFDPVKNAVATLFEQLGEAPFVTIDVAPTGGSVQTGSILSQSNATAVSLIVLDGLVEIVIGTAETQAAIDFDDNGIPTPSASAGAGFIEVRVLNIFDPTAEDPYLINTRIDSPGATQTFLEGTELEFTIRAADGGETTSCDVGEVTDCRAIASADTVGLYLFSRPADMDGEVDSPLPPIVLRLAGADSEATYQAAASEFQPVVPLARTGAGALVTILAGAGLIGAGVLVRRRLLAG